jgi:hypothetical protein
VLEDDLMAAIDKVLDGLIERDAAKTQSPRTRDFQR